MADLVQTTANVAIMAQDTTTKNVQAGPGATITPGNPVYLATTGRYELSDADVLITADVDGIAMTPAGNDGWFIIATSGLIDLGAALDVNTEYVPSGTAGKIMPNADLSNPQVKTSLGSATATDTLDLRIVVTEIEEPV